MVTKKSTPDFAFASLVQRFDDVLAMQRAHDAAARIPSNRVIGVFTFGGGSTLHVPVTSTYRSFWYAAMCVVIEGYVHLKLRDPKIDQALRSSHRKRLQDYRNTVFHYMPKLADKRLLAFASNPGALEWIHKLTELFSDFFKREISRRDAVP
jgi:hypothetical protein